jgi:hypothetical protein
MYAQRGFLQQGEDIYQRAMTVYLLSRSNRFVQVSGEGAAAGGVLRRSMEEEELAKENYHVLFTRPPMIANDTSF